MKNITDSVVFRQIKACFKRSFFVLILFGTANWYQGIDKPTIWQWLYKWRTSFRTSIKIDKILHTND
jgi:hypothetical protein